MTNKNEINKNKIYKTIQSITKEYMQESLEFIEHVFTDHYGKEEGREVRALVEEIRSKKYYLPDLELIALDEDNHVIGYVMFSRFHLNGNYEEELLLLTPAAVETRLQRQHISKDMIEFGFRRAKEMGFKAILVEGDPANYHARGFETAANHGIVPGKTVHLPHINCLMVKELVQGALDEIQGTLEYDYYEAL